MSRRFRISAVLVLCAAAAAGACSLVNDLSDYTGGPSAKDSGTVDSSSSDTSTPVDTAMAETGDDDTGTPPDSGDDTGTASTDGGDSTIGDSAPDSASTDSSDSMVVDSGSMGDVVIPEAGDAGCGTLCLFGVSEIMVRPTSGTGDKREWVELTNYGTSTIDVSGVTVKVFSGITERGTLTFPAGTMVKASEAVVIVDDVTAFKADVAATFTLGQVFGFTSAFGMDMFVNSGPTVRVYAPGSSAAYESAISSKSTWTVGHSWAYPVPAAACAADGRFVAGTGAYTAPWKETAADLSAKYGEYMAGSPAMPVALYGTPTQANATIACP